MELNLWQQLFQRLRLRSWILSSLLLFFIPLLSKFLEQITTSSQNKLNHFMVSSIQNLHKSSDKSDNSWEDSHHKCTKKDKFKRRYIPYLTTLKLWLELLKISNALSKQLKRKWTVLLITLWYTTNRKVLKKINSSVLEISMGNMWQKLPIFLDLLSSRLENSAKLGFRNTSIAKYQDCLISWSKTEVLTVGLWLLNVTSLSSIDTSAALLSESKVLVKPASVDSIVTSAGQEDHVSMGGFAARKCEMLLHNMTHILGIELLMCACSITILSDLKPSERLAKIINTVHKTLPLL